jgi:shikimate dehydrogenase
MDIASTGLIGDPVNHSLSPAMHNAAFTALGIAAQYELWHTKLEDLPVRIATLREENILGANVTIPHKQSVTPYVDQIAPSAKYVGAINTIVHKGDQLIGHNTDADGLANALRSENLNGFKHALVLGTGGASRAAVVALAAFHVDEIGIMTRRLSSFETIRNDLANLGGFLSPYILEEEERELTTPDLPAFDIIINATPIGMRDVPGIPISSKMLDQMPQNTIIVDMITAPTLLQQYARERGMPLMDGLPMLLHQGALAFTLWTGKEAPIKIMRDALMATQKV